MNEQTSTTTPQRLGVLRNQWKVLIKAEPSAAKKAHITRDFQTVCGINFSLEAKQNLSEAKKEARIKKQKEIKSLLKEKKKAKKAKKKAIAKKEENKKNATPFKVIDYITITERNRQLVAENKKLRNQLA